MLLWTTTVLSDKLDISLRLSNSTGQTQLDILRDVIVKIFPLAIWPVSRLVRSHFKDEISRVCRKPLEVHPHRYSYKLLLETECNHYLLGACYGHESKIILWYDFSFYAAASLKILQNYFVIIKLFRSLDFATESFRKKAWISIITTENFLFRKINIQF